MNTDKSNRVYFLGIGGIGMSALARYFKHKGCEVFGYDKTRTSLTDQLAKEGIEIIYEDDVSIVIEDINPQAPTHLLIIPKKVIPKLSDASNEDQEILGHLMLVAGKIADQLGLDETFRLVVNNGAKAGQSVFHLHLHLISGRSFNWPPG